MAEAKSPYRQESSIIYQAFCAATKGIKEEKLMKLVTDMGGSPFRVLKVLKRGHDSKGVWSWDVDESKGWFKIINVRTAAKVTPTYQATPKRKS